MILVACGQSLGPMYGIKKNKGNILERLELEVVVLFARGYCLLLELFLTLVNRRSIFYFYFCVSVF